MGITQQQKRQCLTLRLVSLNHHSGLQKAFHKTIKSDTHLSGAIIIITIIIIMTILKLVMTSDGLCGVMSLESRFLLD